jgi:hypothetical protein
MDIVLRNSAGSHRHFVPPIAHRFTIECCDTQQIYASLSESSKFQNSPRFALSINTMDTCARIASEEVSS